MKDLIYFLVMFPVNCYQLARLVAGNIIHYRSDLPVRRRSEELNYWTRREY